MKTIVRQRRCRSQWPRPEFPPRSSLRLVGRRVVDSRSRVYCAHVTGSIAIYGDSTISHIDRRADLKVQECARVAVRKLQLICRVEIDRERSACKGDPKGISKTAL